MNTSCRFGFISWSRVSDPSQQRVYRPSNTLATNRRHAKMRMIEWQIEVILAAGAEGWRRDNQSWRILSLIPTETLTHPTIHSQYLSHVLLYRPWANPSRRFWTHRYYYNHSMHWSPPAHHWQYLSHYLGIDLILTSWSTGWVIQIGSTQAIGYSYLDNCIFIYRFSTMIIFIYDFS